MSNYQEYNLTKVGNNYNQYMLFGDKNGEQGDLIATINDLHHAELIIEFLNQMLEEEQLNPDPCNGCDYNVGLCTVDCDNFEQHTRR